MNYLEQIGKNAKKAFEGLKDVKHKKIRKVLDNYNQSLKKNTNKIKGKQSIEIETILGYLSKTEVIHKDDMVLL